MHVHASAADTPSGIEATERAMGRDADVIDLTRKKRTRGEREETPMTGADPDSPEGRLVTTIEAMYLAAGRTLTDPDTAQAHRIALSAALLMIDGAQATGLIGADAHTDLHAMVAAAQDVPAAL